MVWPSAGERKCVLKLDTWKLGHEGATFAFPTAAMLRTFVVFREYLENWPWKETRVVDVGACVGSFALAVAQMLPAARLNVVEPWPDALPWLEENLRAQPGMRCTLHRLAASDRTGERLMVEGPKWGMSTLHGQGAGVMVATAKLDDIIPGPVSLMKLDVEGHELEALRGAATLLRRDRPRLILEMRPDMQEAAGHRRNDLGHYLKELGYEYYVPLTKQDYLYSTEKVERA